ncbi:MAG: hypothetical protein RBR96_04435 [Candidatus Izemoplasmatales bacterium]|nr:hypothetical protein [Candidatus Izemoplasmatales bacterium]
MDVVRLLNYMENLRYDRKMSQETYLSGVISQRQYYRYRSGESEVPFEVIVKFADKLGIPLLKLISTYQSSYEKEKEIVITYLNLVLSNRLLEAKQFIDKQRSLYFLEDDISMLYNVAKLINDYFSKKINLESLVKGIKERIKFTEIMKKEILHDIELYFFGLIMDFSEVDREIIFQKINFLRKNDKLLLGGNPLLDAQVYFWIIKNLGRMNRYVELVEIADIALDYCKKQYTYYLKEYFHYYKALAYYRMDKLDLFETELFKTIFVLYQLDEFKRKHFMETIKKDTGIDCKSFLIDKIEKELA